MERFHRLPLMLAMFLGIAVSWTSSYGQANVPGQKRLNLAGVRVEKDIVYLHGANTEKLDIYRPEMLEKVKRCPAIVLIHGGGFTEGRKDRALEQRIAADLARAGYICASIDYSLATKDLHTWPDVLYQCKSAVQFLRKNATLYQIEPDHIGVMGDSAGAYLALMVGLTSVTGALQPPGPYQGISSRVQAVADFYGATNLPTADADENCAMMLGVNKKNGLALWERESPINNVTFGAPPVLVAQGSEDTESPVGQSEELVEKLKEKGVPYQYIFVKGAGHSFDFHPPQQDLCTPVIAFFDKYLKREK